jgi:hypothetical protein
LVLLYFWFGYDHMAICNVVCKYIYINIHHTLGIQELKCNIHIDIFQIIK